MSDFNGNGIVGQPLGAQPATAQVRYGVYQMASPTFVGLTIEQFRATQGRMWNLPADAKAYVGPQEVNENYTIQAGNNVEFHRRAGEKG